MVLHVGQGQSDAATLNLAQVRQRGAQLGANEVHVHFSAASDAARSLVACDLRAGQFGRIELRAQRAPALTLAAHPVYPACRPTRSSRSR